MDLEFLAPWLEARGGRLFDTAEGVDIARAIARDVPWISALDPVVLFDQYTSDYPLTARAGPLRGYIFHLRHDDGPLVLFRSLEELVVAMREPAEVEDLSPTIDPRTVDRTVVDEAGAEFLFGIPRAGDEPAGATHCGIQLVGPSWARLLLPLLEGDMWVREAAADRLAVVADLGAVRPLQRVVEAVGTDRQDGRQARRAISAIRRRTPGPLP